VNSVVSFANSYHKTPPRATMPSIGKQSNLGEIALCGRGVRLAFAFYDRVTGERLSGDAYQATLKKILQRHRRYRRRQSQLAGKSRRVGSRLLAQGVYALRERLLRVAMLAMERKCWLGLRQELNACGARLKISGIRARAEMIRFMAPSLFSARTEQFDELSSNHLFPPWKEVELCRVIDPL
jgi:hypothetical protein